MSTASLTGRRVALIVTVGLLIAALASTVVARGASWTRPLGDTARWRSAAQASIGPLSSHRLLIVGASYTQGVGAVPETNGYAYVVGRTLHWPTTVAGAAGTGFVNIGPRQQGTFLERIRRLPLSLDPGLILIQCGRNDIGYPPGAVRSAVDATVVEIGQRFPRARLVLMGPIPGVAPVGTAVTQDDALLRAQAAKHSLPFIDVVTEKWITAANVVRFTGAVPAHPNNAGHAFIAGKVVADLGELSHGQIAVA